MAFEPIQPSINPSSLSVVSKNTSENNKLNKPVSLLDQTDIKKSNVIEDTRDEDKKERDKISLSETAQQLLQTSRTEDKNSNEKITIDKVERSALEFRGLAQIAKTRDLTESESNKINKIKNDFAEVGLDEKDISRVAERKLQQIRQEAPQLVQKLDNGDITGAQFARLTSINESLNKANGFGISDVSQPDTASAPKIEKVRNDFDSLVEVTKDRQLSREDLDNLDRLERQLSAIQGFQLNVRKTVGPNGVII